MAPILPPVANSALSATGLRYEIPGRTLLDGATLTVESGQSVAVTGPSGSGKSTLLMCLLGLLQPKSGRIEIAGKEITRMRPGQLAKHRRDSIGMVFQFAELLPELSPVENVALAALLAGRKRGEAFSRAEELLDELAVSGALSTATTDLSGGERQRVAVARALINEPALLLADEPTGALDEENRDSVATLLFSLPKRWNCGLLVVTHDASIAGQADRHVVLRQGAFHVAEHAGGTA
ncbi:ABC transporter ATP-binding protein [Streptomyces uncialis]|uniref:ABC transporter ATP-binding protein n=1 Tax=Streptomyces uncialis TaxID=1048205 RepID=A0A1Q4V7Y0_9ACTN|nr:ABC transporter ATP-binding protein [Streptomyces uncialis]OKH93936.1 ABC transporter ATP-binding protein [Streptomyces uncialis]